MHWYTENETFWGNKHEEAVARLQEEIPVMGEVKDKTRPALEEWRRLQNAYYRFYNDGDGYGRQLRHMFKRHCVEMPSRWSPEDILEQKLEELADRVFKCALDEQASKRA